MKAEPTQTSTMVAILSDALENNDALIMGAAEAELGTPSQ
jgi:hypothetical protein